MKAAYETLSDSEKKATCLNVVENARKDLEADMLRRRREMRAAGKTVIIPEDDPNQYKQALHKRAVKVSLPLFEIALLSSKNS